MKFDKTKKERKAREKQNNYILLSHSPQSPTVESLVNFLICVDSVCRLVSCDPTGARVLRGCIREINRHFGWKKETKQQQQKKRTLNQNQFS